MIINLELTHTLISEYLGYIYKDILISCQLFMATVSNPARHKFSRS